VALYGRKINSAEDQLTFIRYLRAVADDQLGPEEAVRAYHAELKRLGIPPQRTLAEDLTRTQTADSYAGTAARSKPLAGKPALPRQALLGKPAVAPGKPAVAPAGKPAKAPGRPAEEPDFSKMTPAEKARWNLERWKRIIG
jgi:hypothetical protein